MNSDSAKAMICIFIFVFAVSMVVGFYLKSEKDRYKDIADEYYIKLVNNTNKYNSLVGKYNNKSDELIDTQYELINLKNNYSADLRKAEQEIDKEYRDYYSKQYVEKVDEHLAMVRSYIKNESERIRKTIRAQYEKNCKDYILCNMKKKDIDFDLNGVYYEDDGHFYCVDMENANQEQIKKRDCHEALHHFIVEDWRHFCRISD